MINKQLSIIKIINVIVKFDHTHFIISTRIWDYFNF